MAEGMATLTIIGSVGRDAEVKQAGGTTVIEFNVAVNSWAKAGETTAWYRVSMFGQRGEKLASMIRKGDRIGVSGRLVPREYTGKDGASKMSLDLKADSITLLGSKRDAAERGESRFATPPRLDRDDDGRGYSGVAAQGELGDAMDETPF
jgi:single-strand DNA-binding protein